MKLADTNYLYFVISIYRVDHGFRFMKRDDHITLESILTTFLAIVVFLKQLEQ